MVINRGQNMKSGYARVSTFEQKLESQIEVLKEAGAEEVFQKKIYGDYS